MLQYMNRMHVVCCSSPKQFIIKGFYLLNVSYMDAICSMEITVWVVVSVLHKYGAL